MEFYNLGVKAIQVIDRDDTLTLPLQPTTSFMGPSQPLQRLHITNTLSRQLN